MNPVATGGKVGNGQIGHLYWSRLSLYSNDQIPAGRFILAVSTEEVTDSAAGKILRCSFPQENTVTCR